jgi:hypothetical protein
MTREALLGIVALFAIAGCAQQPGDHTPGMTHWDYSPPLNGDGMHIALINAAGMQNTMQLYCHEPSKDLVLQVVPKDLEGEAKAQMLTLAYDGGTPTSQPWRAEMDKGHFFDFSVALGEPGFDAAVRDLKTHHSVEIVISTAGKEVRRQKFSLERAAETIDRVLAVCGHPIPV